MCKLLRIWQKHNVSKFKLGYFYSEVDKEYLLTRMNNGDKIEGLDGRSDLTKDDLEKQIVLLP